MAPTILVVGSTGNTGKSVVHSLPKLLESSKTLAGYRVLGLTRSLESLQDVSWIDDLAKSGVYSEKVLSSIRFGCIPLWKERCSLSEAPTELAAPKRTPALALQTMLQD